MAADKVPPLIPNWINGTARPTRSGASFVKRDPATGSSYVRVARSKKSDVADAVAAATKAQPDWAHTSVVRRAEVLRELALLLRTKADFLVPLVAQEAGKSMKDSRAELDAAFEMGMFMAGEGRRYYGKTTGSAVPNRSASIVRQPVGVAGLIISANTPLPNVAWKAFPAMLCGNAVVLKPSEDAPVGAWAFARLTKEAGVPNGVFNVVQGFGPEAGAPLVEHPGVPLISFTGSSEVGRYIQAATAPRLAKVCLELGGKNPLVVCDDADLRRAADWAARSAFSNAGQRCASGSRIIVFGSVYEEFRRELLVRTSRLRVGTKDEDDFGPVINASQLEAMLAAVAAAKRQGARVLTGGDRLVDKEHRGGYYVAPTLLEKVSADAPISRTELFGPISILYRVRGLDEAIALANDSPFGLTAAIHTQDLDRAHRFTQEVQAGMVVVNGGTFGNEPHTPFGGVKQSGNGWREPGTEALDVYSEWKTVYTFHDRGRA